MTILYILMIDCLRLWKKNSLTKSRDLVMWLDDSGRMLFGQTAQDRGRINVFGGNLDDR